MPGVIRGDGFGSLEIVVDFLAIEDVEDEFSSGVHEMLIDVVHGVVNNDVPHSFLCVSFEVLLLLDQMLKDLVKVFGVLVLVPEKHRKNHRS